MLKSGPLAILAATTLLAACGGTPDARVAVPRADVVQKQRIAYGTVALRAVSLPTYAAAEDIYIAGLDGVISPGAGLLWADEPGRAITLELTRYLAQITGARVASEPWPFLDRAQVEVELRIEEMLAHADGTFRLSGQYFVAPESGRDRANLFSLVTPIGGAFTAQDIAAARGAAMRQLAGEIAARGLR
ncbi:PqiC family protein [Roseovarius dicentrarchi]|uniref:PqiC family protein n=1 Tax=Roseovarius dicentrarchi TaxID=2250573 RepID=UPI000DEB4E7A|nr:ABC-type transport auxiliary lipoprotein family protein [Roseovarius dicentrarchi]